MKKAILIIPILFLFSCGSDDLDISPTMVQINTITVLNYPMLMNTGTVWDTAFLDAADENPDPFFIISSGTSPLFTSGQYFNATGEALTFSNLGIELYPTNQYVFGLYDADIVGSDTMGEFYFIPYNFINGTPDTRIFTSGDLSIEVGLSYIY